MAWGRYSRGREREKREGDVGYLTGALARPGACESERGEWGKWGGSWASWARGCGCKRKGMTAPTGGPHLSVREEDAHGLGWLTRAR